MKKWQKIPLGLLAVCVLLSGCGQAPGDGRNKAPADTVYAANVSFTAFAADMEAAVDPAEDAPEPEDAKGAKPQKKPEKKEQPAPAEWYTTPVFAHAMGTVAGRADTNCLDAFLENYAAGQRVFEVDLQLTSDGHLVARHDWEQNAYDNTEQEFAGVMDWETFMHTPICFFYTPVDIDTLVSLMQEYPDVCFVTDGKDTDEDTVRAQIREIARAIDEAGDPSLWDQVIVQIYHEDMYGWVAEEAPVTNWIFTLYKLRSPNYDEIGAFCQEHDIPVVAMSYERLNEESSGTLHSYGRLVYVHTVNRLSSAVRMSPAADGFYSDCITPSQLEAVLSGTNQMYLSGSQTDVGHEKTTEDVQNTEK